MGFLSLYCFELIAVMAIVCPPQDLVAAQDVQSGDDSTFQQADQIYSNDSNRTERPEVNAAMLRAPKMRSRARPRDENVIEFHQLHILLPLAVSLFLVVSIGALVIYHCLAVYKLLALQSVDQCTTTVKASFMTTATHDSSGGLFGSRTKSKKRAPAANMWASIKQK